MECKLFKKVTPVTKQTKEGAVTKNYTTYYLRFTNGVKVEIVPKYYDVDNVQDKQRVDLLKRLNVANATTIKVLSDDEDMDVWLNEN